jgi:hypothetical protein
METANLVDNWASLSSACELGGSYSLFDEKFSFYNAGLHIKDSNREC